jgi:uncharacterized protein
MAKIRAKLVEKRSSTMIQYLRRDRWSPYVVGLGIGVLLTFLFVMGHEFGVSSGVARWGQMLQSAVSGREPTHLFGSLWKMLFVVGILLGSWIASRISDGVRPATHTIWESAFGTSKLKRYGAAFVGGTLLMFGARLADGCTSGHAICGAAQLSVVSWVFMMTLFAVAIPVSLLMYGRK